MRDCEGGRHVESNKNKLFTSVWMFVHCLFAALWNQTFIESTTSIHFGVLSCFKPILSWRLNRHSQFWGCEMNSDEPPPWNFMFWTFNNSEATNYASIHLDLIKKLYSILLITYLARHFCSHSYPYAQQPDDENKASNNTKLLCQRENDERVTCCAHLGLAGSFFFLECEQRDLVNMKRTCVNKKIYMRITRLDLNWYNFHRLSWV